MSDDVIVPRRSPGNPRTQSVVILDPEDISAELLNTRGPKNSRVNGLSPPYSSHSQAAALLLVALAIGVVLAWRLPPKPSTLDAQALHAWMSLAAIWLPLMFWVLLEDPKAHPPCQCSRQIARCRHGCLFEVAPRTRHCRKCDKCVAGFDHHCLWLNTCIGTRNYQKWLLFLFMLCFWTLLGSWISYSALFRCRHIRPRRLSVGHRPAVLLTATLATLAAAWLLLLLALHAYLNYKGISTLEWATGAGRPIDLQRCQRLQFSIVSMSCFPKKSLIRDQPPELPKKKSKHWSKLRQVVLSEPSLNGLPNLDWRRRISLSSVAVEESSESEESDALTDSSPDRPMRCQSGT